MGRSKCRSTLRLCHLRPNSGHDEPDHIPGWETPNGLIDWSHRALHLSTLTAKAIVKAWYGVEPKYTTSPDAPTEADKS